MTHAMTLDDDHEGTETWSCAECGRTLLIEWHPWRKVELVPGDEYALHAGGKGGLSVGSMRVRKVSDG